MSPMERYTQHVLTETQCAAEERKEIEKELLSHLQDLKEYFLTLGYSDKDAEKKAIAEFGGSKLIGQGLQESMYPWQRGLLYIIGMASILFGVLFHLYTLFVLQEPSVGWLAIQFIAGTLVTLAAINIAFVGRHPYLLHVVVAINLIWNGLMLLFINYMPHVLFFIIYLIILISIVELSSNC